MLQKLLTSTDLRQLTSFVSPAFFDVMPARKLWSRGRALITTRARPLYQDAVKQRATELARVPLSVRLPSAPTAAVRDPLGADLTGNATRLVTLYFHQLFSDTPTLLDLRKASCRADDTTLVWDPAPWVCSWEPGFLHSLRALYRGFYADDDAVFRRALKELHIDRSEDLFREHFGAEQAGQSFAMRDFVRTFHEVFVRCRDSNTRLHEDFLPLGVYLATLYDHLDGLAMKVDVRGCFERAQHAGDAPQGNVSSSVGTRA